MGIQLLDGIYYNSADDVIKIKASEIFICLHNRRDILCLLSRHRLAERWVATRSGRLVHANSRPKENL